jgi:large subunit ribosomal protein L10
MPKPGKVALVQEISAKLAEAKGAVIVDYRGLTVKEDTELRKKLREAGVEYVVVKNTLLNLAAREHNIEGLDPILSGPTAIAYGLADPVAPAKILKEFAKDHKNLEIKGGILGTEVIDVKQVEALAELPTKEQLIAMLLRTLQGPIAGLVNCLQGNIRNLVYVLDAVRNQKESA